MFNFTTDGPRLIECAFGTLDQRGCLKYFFESRALFYTKRASVSTLYMRNCYQHTFYTVFRQYIQVWSENIQVPSGD